MQVLQDLLYVLLQLLVVAAISWFKFYRKFHCMFYFTCDRSFRRDQFELCAVAGTVLVLRPMPFLLLKMLQ